MRKLRKRERPLPQKKRGMFAIRQFNEEKVRHREIYTLDPRRTETAQFLDIFRYVSLTTRPFIDCMKLSSVPAVCRPLIRTALNNGAVTRDALFTEPRGPPMNGSLLSQIVEGLAMPFI